MFVHVENVSRLKKLEYLNLALNNIEVIENLEGQWQCVGVFGAECILLYSSKSFWLLLHFTVYSLFYSIDYSVDNFNKYKMSKEQSHSLAESTFSKQKKRKMLNPLTPWEDV